jgi:hypothetical protein
MPYAGKTLMQREVVALVAPHWPNSKVKATATAIAESRQSLGAWHDNLRDDGTISSRDCGLFQISIDGDEIGSQKEGRLRTESLIPEEYLDVARYNVKWAYSLWAERKWQPWVAYTSGWAMYPEAWAWHRIEGKPAGPWVTAGRYLHQAIRAVANWHLLIASDLSIEGAVANAEVLADQCGITKGAIVYDARHAVYWKYPPAPTDPPTGEPWGYPIQNDGQ